MVRPTSFTQQRATLQRTMQQNHVGAIPAGGRPTGDFAARNGAMQRPSAGIGSNRQTNNGFGNRGTMTQAGAAQNQNRGGFRPFNAPSNAGRAPEASRGASTQPGFRPFTPPSGNRSAQSAGAEPQRAQSGGFRPFAPPSSSARPEMNNSVSRPQSNSGGFRPFTPPSRSETRNPGPSSNYNRGSSGGYWNRTAPSAPAQRNYSDGFSRGSSSARPQLDMHQPIVRTPSYGGGGNRAPSYGGSRGTPSYGGSHGAPSYGGGGGRAPSGGGGHVGVSSGGGHTSGGGGGHFGGGGGGGHSSGGGASHGGGHR